MRIPATRGVRFWLLMWATLAAAAATRLSVGQLLNLVTAARAAGASDQEIAAKLAGVELKERLIPAGFPADLGPQTQERLRILALESAFLLPPAAAVPGKPATSAGSAARAAG